MERYTQSLFGIDLFIYSEVYQLDGSNLQFTDVEFLLDDLKQFNGNCVEIDLEWNMKIWTDDGEQLNDLNILDVSSFKNKLIALISS